MCLEVPERHRGGEGDCGNGLVRRINGDVDSNSPFNLSISYESDYDDFFFNSNVFCVCPVARTT